MIDTSKAGERMLQKYRFRMALPYIKGDVMDFGGNEGELRPFVKGDYLAVNYDHSVMAGRRFDTIAALAVIEHIEVEEVFRVFKALAQEHLNPGGKMVLTTPTKAAKPVLEILARLGVVGRENIAEHKHYWSKKEMDGLARSCGLRMEMHKRFQLGFNQIAVFSQASSADGGY